MPAIRLLRATVASCLVVLTGCAGLPLIGALGISGGNLEAQTVTALAGRVDFGPAGDRSVQGTIGDIAVAATVSLLDVDSNTTVSTALTDKDGFFILNFKAGFLPDPRKYYIIEGIKGLGGNLPGNDAARVRTIANWTPATQWQSITASGLTITPTTTALAIIQASYLVAGRPSLQSDPARYMGLVVGKSGQSDAPDPLKSGQNVVTSTALDAVFKLVNKAITFDADPVAAVTYNAQTDAFGASSLAVAPSISVIVPSGAARGSEVDVFGTRFSRNAGGNAVFLGTKSLAITRTSEASLSVRIPDDAISGNIKVVTADGESNLVPFVVFPDPGGFLQP